MRTSEQFRNMIKASGVIQIPGCYDCITATIVERAGFPAAYLTGSGISLTLSGIPDLNTISYLELRQVVQNIRSAIQIPMLVDIDTGFGAPLNLYRLTKEFEQLDIAAVQIEDQKVPKKCGHELGRRLVRDEEMVKRIRTIHENRLENGLVIVARTDARTVVGLDEAIRRGRLYLDAGADVIFVESPESYEEVKKIASEIKGPVLFNNVEGGRSPFLSRQELEEAGVKMTIYPNAQTRVVAKKCMELLNTLQQTGTTAGMENEMLSHRELWSMFNSEKWVAIEKKYMPD
ncbi:oxaloacetate decarboxylase [Lawsonibacter asaccharolyticus]|uniref:isocitrate lyase/PEP mutase family protein n=1 Tax=Eubacteriales TaxID=186802 RepID=UPI000D28E60F|nr:MULTISPECIES: oxaloacetate decarboxylase [Eubacteriales]MBS5506404.1 oxaloacetate decarboxylase [Oscillospiraceae bacterium]MBS5590608.1 oxaloacetate decarboxylase [Clostridiales bacterium]MCB5926812.1 oxaloacetate decarboxylase [bacterium 210820-DFI.5.26]UMM47359.1 oxaloacetate decarboxylase [Lawsonibacter asaccharolyticus]GBF67881.1 carboxyvinyl-carboxyphosphonate phosphorylmutase [Lawsonibacter asaccharolyticus]